MAVMVVEPIVHRTYVQVAAPVLAVVELRSHGSTDMLVAGATTMVVAAGAVESAVLESVDSIHNHRDQDLIIHRRVVPAETEYRIPILEYQDFIRQVAVVPGFGTTDRLQDKEPMVVTAVRSVTGVVAVMDGRIVRADQHQPILAGAVAEDGDTVDQLVLAVAG